MEFRIYLQMIQRSWWIVLLTAFAALLLALVAIYVVTPIYQATATFIVNPNLASTSTEKDVLNSLQALDKRSIIATYAEVLNSQKIFINTATTLGLSPDQIADYTHSTVVLPDANVLELSVEGPDPQMVAVLANSLGQQAINYISQLYSVYELTFLDSANVPEIPIRPRPIRDASLAFGLGLVMGAVLAIVREQLRTPLEAFLQRTRIDPASGVLTRRHFEDQLSDVIAANPETTLSLGLIRLDGLMGYIQLLPQPMAQRVLHQITDIMRKELRGNDIIGRWENGTFAILLPETSGGAAVATLGRVQLALSKPIRYSPDGETMHLEPKVGISERFKGDPVPLLIERVESALSEADLNEAGLMLYKTRAFTGY